MKNHNQPLRDRGSVNNWAQLLILKNGISNNTESATKTTKEILKEAAIRDPHRVTGNFKKSETDLKRVTVKLDTKNIN